MNKIQLGIGVALLLTLFSCRPEAPLPALEPDYFIFGHYYGFCQGEQCVELFKLEDGKLYEDTEDQYPAARVPFDFEWLELDKEKYKLAKDFPEQFPQALLDTEEPFLGTPDAADGGGLFVMIQVGGERTVWYIDLVTDNIPEEIRPFVVEAQEVINDLQ